MSTLPRLALVVALALPQLAAASDLRVSGTCPGPMTLSGSGFAPNERIVLTRSTGLGSFLVPGGSCTGTEILLDSPTILTSVRADAAGEFSITGPVSNGDCGTHVQAVEISTCETSGVVAVQSTGLGCVVDMDNTCPDAAPVCGVTASGGGTCMVDNSGFCSTTPSSSFRIPMGETLTLTFDRPVNELIWFLSGSGGGVPIKTTYDELGNQIVRSGQAFTCDLSQPPRSVARFYRPVRSIVIEAIGGDAYLDSIEINP